VELRERLEQLRAQLAALPTRELDRLYDLDAEDRELTERRDAVRDELARLPQPRRRGLGRVQDPHLVDRTQLSSTLAGLEVQLQEALTERATLAREFGDVDPVRQERDGLIAAAEATRKEHGRLLERLVEREVADRPRWTRGVLGGRPERRSSAARWDRAARILARYRLDYDISDEGNDPLGAEPAAADQRREYQRAVRAREQLDREIGRDVYGPQLDVS
jgi:hypothetical protein